MPISRSTNGCETGLRVLEIEQIKSVAQGLKVAMFFSRTYARLLRPGLAEITDTSAIPTPALRSAFHRLQTTIDQRCEELKLAA